MRDVQMEPDSRGLSLDKVGIRGLKYPLTLRDKNNRYQHTVAEISLYVNLPHHFRGTHMSRFIEVLEQYRGTMSISNMEKMLLSIKDSLEASSAHLEIRFPYFIEKEAPVSRSKSLSPYSCRFLASHNHSLDFILEVEVPVTSLCPCSKEISQQGAHNQRGILKAQVRSKSKLWIEDLVKLIEDCASCEIYTLLKREDEKFVTEKAYERAMFVEDMVREVASRLCDLEQILWFKVEAETMESIHTHNAYACIERSLMPQGD